MQFIITGFDQICTNGFYSIDINNALIELNADRNLFEVNRIPELEGICCI